MENPSTSPPSVTVARTARRALAPDLARGGMLLLIAFAHAPLFVSAIDRGPEVVNEVTKVFHLLFVHNHARPLFAFLFGYALVQLMNRQQARGASWTDVRTLVRRRGWWLVAIGSTHVLLFTPLDILAPYGIAGLLLVGLLRAKDSTLLWMTGVTMIPATAAAALGMWLPLSQGVSSYTVGSMAIGDRDWVEALGDRMAGWPYGLVIGVLLVIPGVVFGMWVARRRVLDEPENHRALLWRFSVAATVASVLGALPAVLLELGAWSNENPVVVLTAATAQPLTGYAGGIALAGFIALVALAVADRPGRLTTAVQALGQRSMSMYLFQTVVWVAVFAPFGMGLEDRTGLAGATVIAIATWVVSVIVAELMRRAGYRGPAEIMLRRLSYPQARPAAR
ncbi:DUF418 domain-containing protein [Promicromonospora sp. CA-289599]|uniref:DUF418 domain-containing protein n=1 Tax=Promicromonospora sp. CA-289599 TaxID=3240014 RepID=UPI003D9092F9